MSKIEKIILLAELYDIYKELLSDKQREAFELYYFDDYSLSEIAEKKNITKTSIHEMIKKTEDKLSYCEEKLKISSKNKKINNIINNVNNLTKDEIVKLLHDINE